MSKLNYEDQKKALCFRIKEIFPVTPMPEESELIETSWSMDLEREKIKRFLSGKAWISLTLSHLQKGYKGDQSAILSLISDIGFKYYFPAFLLIGLNDYHVADREFTSAIDAFRLSARNDKTMDSWTLKRVRLFSTNQLETIRDTFDFIKTNNSDFIETEYIDKATKTINSILDQQK